jgi:hypothetical protein
VGGNEDGFKRESGGGKEWVESVISGNMIKYRVDEGGIGVGVNGRVGEGCGGE